MSDIISIVVAVLVLIFIFWFFLKAVKLVWKLLLFACLVGAFFYFYPSVKGFVDQVLANVLG